MIHLDTHVVVWLFQGRRDAFPADVLEALGARRPLVSPMVRLELALLHQIGRITVPPELILNELRAAADLGVAESSFDRVAAVAATLHYTRDPFDRLIAAHALADDLPLVTRDATLLQNCRVAWWGGGRVPGAS
jgi:PIN domain nuclease of toxin-antitoxin system